MNRIIGIRKEIKNEWERRVPLTPDAVAELKSNNSIKTIIQSSEIRIIPDDQYKSAGAEISDDLSSAEVILAVKEIPVEDILEKKIYLFFSHTIKGQDYNMPLLQKIIDNKCTLIDYEPITDDTGKRLVFFGRHAGYAGMINGLYSLGRRLKAKGISNAFEEINQAKDYTSLTEAKSSIKKVGNDLHLPDVINPLVIGITGYGNVSQGAQNILDQLNVTEISPKELLTSQLDKDKIYKVIFKEEDIVERIADGGFDLNEYYTNPEKYRSKFHQYLPKINLLVNAVYWEDKYPRLVTKEFVNKNYPENLHVIADLSCDINGSIEMTEKATLSDNPVFLYDPLTNATWDGFEGKGILLMTVDNLPAEIPLESSEWFSESLMPLISKLFEADFFAEFDNLNLIPALKNACIVYKGELTPNYKYLEGFLKRD